MMNLANRLTILRVCMIPVFLIVLFMNLGGSYTRLIAAAIFVLASFTDFLDGYIARSRNMVTNFGKFMDPLADKLLVCAALIAMVESKDLAAWVVIIIISREFIITGFRLIAVEKNLVLAASFWAKCKTATQMVMIPYLLTGLQNVSSLYALLGNALVLLSVIFSVVSAIEYILKNLNVLHD